MVALNPLPLPLGVLISGEGTNLQAIIDAILDEALNAEIKVVISNKPDAPGLVRAQNAGIPTAVLEHDQFASREAYDRALAKELQDYGVELVAMAGFMRIVTPVLLSAFPNAVVNIHPSLLPAFKGAHAVRDALAAKVTKTGCTVHYVVPAVDAGPIILQAEVAVLPGDTEETLAARIHEAEHKLYPEALQELARHWGG